MARPRLIPWHSSVGVARGLPTTRAEWLARVLPLVREHPSDRDIAAALGVPRTTWRTWRAWLTAAHAAGALIEWGDGPLPSTRRGAVVGAPLRGAARARAEARRAREAVIPAVSCG